MKKNLLIKILVLFIAILLWMLQVLLKTHEQSILVPIKLINTPSELVLEEDELPKVNVQIKAKGTDILYLKLSKIFFEINAEKFKYGKNRLKISEKNLTYSNRVLLQILKIDTSKNYYVSMDKLVEKKKPVEIRYTSAKDEEFFIVNKITNPLQRVTVKGPLAILNNIKRIQTEQISKKMVEDGKLFALLVTPDPKVVLLKDRVVFKVTQTKIINRTISLIPIKFPEKENISIIPQKVSVMIRGPKEIVEKLDNKTIIANLNISKIRKNFTEVYFEVPTGVRIVEYTPKKIQVIRNE